MIREISLENLFKSMALMKATASFMLDGINSNVTLSRYAYSIKIFSITPRDEMYLEYKTLNGKMVKLVRQFLKTNAF